VLALIPNQTVNEGVLLSVGLQASDPDGDQVLTFALVSGPPGMVINPSSGLLTWTPTEAQGPSTNDVTVSVTDNGTPSLRDSRTCRVLVNEVNSAPTLAAVANRTVNEGSLLTVNLSATDPDLPANNLTYSLLNEPAGMVLDPITGVLTWTPSEAQGPSTNVI